MKSRILACAALLLSGTAGYGQFHYTLTSVPDSSVVTLNNRVVCATPCQVSFRWRDAVDGKFIIGVSSPGFESWSDTLIGKPRKLRFRENVVLERTPFIAKVDTPSVPVSFDRLLAEFDDDHQYGEYVNSRGKVEPLVWGDRTKVGTEHFNAKFYELASKVGIRPPEKPVTPLFSDSRNPVAVPQARFTVAAQLVGYGAYVVESKSNNHGAGRVKGTTRMRLEWQVKDRVSKKVVLTRTTEGVSRDRKANKNGSINNLGAFEDALVKFLHEGSFIELVSKTEPGILLGTSPEDTVTYTVSRPDLPAFKTQSEMIMHAELSCVTLVTEAGHGSGVIIDGEGYVLSAYHVVQGASRIEVQFSNGQKQDARVLAFDEEHDIVLLDISGSGYRSLPIGSGDALGLGEEVLTIGTPADPVLGQSVAKGILSGKRVLEGRTYLQTDMALSPGNSGGPLLNSLGEVVGIIQSKFIGTGIEGIGFALPMEKAMEILHISSTTP